MRRRLATTALIAAGALGAGTAHAAAPRIVFVTEDEESTTLSSILPTGKGERIVTYTSNYDSDPAWGPSHRRVAFARNGHIFIVRADGKHTRRVPNTKRAESPAWSPDARTIVFSARRKKAVAVFTIRTNGTHLRRLTRFRPDPQHYIFGLNPRYTPSGRSITYDGPKGVVKMRANGRRKRLLVPDASNLDWAPNGKRVAFVRDFRIFVARANGTKPRSLTDPLPACEDCDRSDDDPAWSPSGRRIAYSQTYGFEESDEHGVHTIRPDGKGDRQLTYGDYSEPDW